MNSDNTFLHSKILIVDDDRLTTEIVQKYLRAAGFLNTQTLCDPKQVMQTIDEYQPDMVLLDIFMPSIDGLELLRQIKSRPELEKLIVLMLSSADEREQYKSLEMGAAGFIKKPVTPEISNHVNRAFNVAQQLGRLIQQRNAFDPEPNPAKEDTHQVSESI